MLTINQNTPFIATWNESNAKLNPDNQGMIGKVASKIKNFIFYIPNSIIATCINPRSASEFYYSAKLQTNYGNFTKEVVTPGPNPIHLAVNVHVVQGATSDTPTAMLFNPLGADDFVHSGLKESLISRNCNVVTFNYRGLGSTWRAKDLTVDGESVYQYVTKELGTHHHKVNFYGFSLGGAIAAQVKALHPESEGKYVGDRPFKSLFSLITEICCIEKLGWVVKKITAFASAIFLAYPVYFLGWEWDGAQALKHLKGEKLVVYHPHDYLVPFEAALASQCPANEVLRLNPDEIGPSTHFASLEAHDTDAGQAALDVVADFLSH